MIHICIQTFEIIVLSIAASLRIYAFTVIHVRYVYAGLFCIIVGPIQMSDLDPIIIWTRLR